MSPILPPILDKGPPLLSAVNEKSATNGNVLNETAAKKKELQDTTWADGLRGIAALFVVSSHMSLCFLRYTQLPAQAEGGPSWVMQKPFFRLVASGPAWVAIFLILTGFVNSLKPIKLARAGNVEMALSNLSVSAFRRSFRLVLPATAATVISWVLCQFGAYEIARNSDAYWIQITSPAPSPSLFEGIEDLLRAIKFTWMFDPDNRYDQPQWALLYFLLGSMFIYAILLITVNMTPRFRLLTVGLCYMLSWNWARKIGDPMVGASVFAGLVLAEINDSNIPYLLSRYSVYYFAPLTIFSLFLMSFPSEYQHFASWSNTLLDITNRYGPPGLDPGRTLPTMGAKLLCLTILISPQLRRILAHRALAWLGKVSFPLYLLHGTLMRSLLAWMLFAGKSLAPISEPGRETVMRYPLPGMAVFVIAIPVFWVSLGVCSHLWANNIEPYFGKFTKRAEDLMFGKESRPPPLPTRQD